VTQFELKNFDNPFVASLDFRAHRPLDGGSWRGHGVMVYCQITEGSCCGRNNMFSAVTLLSQEKIIWVQPKWYVPRF